MPKRILIVDAEPDTVKAFALLFNKWGFEVETALNGAKAIEVLGSIPLAGITLGLKMPHLNGFEVLRLIRQTDQKIPVIIISGFLDLVKERDNLYQYLRTEAQALFPKPFEGQELKAAVDRWFQTPC